MENYKVIKALGQGTWGVVHMAKQIGTDRIVAIKKIKSERPEEGINFTAVREIKLLREFKHENIIELVDCFTTPDLGVCLVYECAFTDLEKILSNKAISVSLSDVKQHMKSLLTAIAACHDRWILHRDLKPGKKDRDDRLRSSDDCLIEHSPHSLPTHSVLMTKRQYALSQRWYHASRRFRSGAHVWYTEITSLSTGDYVMVQAAGIAVGFDGVLLRGGYVECRLHLCGIAAPSSFSTRETNGYFTTGYYLYCLWYPERIQLARLRDTAALFQRPRMG